MKKIISTVIIMLVAVCCFSTVCFASDNNLTTKETIVSAKYHKSKTELYSSIVEDGVASIVTQNGVSFTVKLHDEFNGFVFVVRPITKQEQEAFQWLKECISNDLADFLAYEFYLINADEEKIEIPLGTEIIISNIDLDYYVSGISCNGNLYEISSITQSSSLIFNTIGNADYYLLRKDTKNNESSNNTNEHSVRPDDRVVQTGDNNNHFLCGIILVVSLIIVALQMKKRKSIF